MSDDKSRYKETLGLSDETEMVHIYVGEKHAEQWKQEADKNNFSSRSKYLYQLIQEARAFRQRDAPGPRQADNRIQELEDKVDRLEEQLEQEQQGSGQLEIDDVDFLTRFLSTEYKPLIQLLQEIVESGALNDLLRKRVEDQLYFLASQDKVQYERGWGWKLADRGDD